MLAEKQKGKLIGAVISKFLKNGVAPTADAILSGVAELMRGRVWGLPTARLRPAIYGYKISGQAGTDIEDTYTEMKTDLELYIESTIDSADSLLTYQASFESKLAGLRARLLHLIQSAKGAVSAFANGSAILLQDTFNNGELIDTARCSVELNINEGYATLPTSMSNLIPLGTKHIKIDVENYPNSGPHGKFADALSDSNNTGWYASLNDSTFIGAFTFLSASGQPTLQKMNGIYVNPMAPMSIKISYSNDGYNFWELVPTETILQAKTWTFAPVAAKSIKIEVTGKATGIFRVQPLVVGYATKGTFYSTPRLVNDMYGKPVTVETVSLETEEETPAGTNIECFAAPLYITGRTGDWLRIGRDPIIISQADTTRTQISTLTQETPGAVRNFYTSTLRLGDFPVMLSGELVRGDDQVFVEYANYNWDTDDGAGRHSPVMGDWDLLQAKTIGYFKASTYNVSVNPLVEGVNPFGGRGGMLFQADQAYANIPENSSYSQTQTRKWLGIAVKRSYSEVLSKGGNYRFTMHVYMPEEKILTDQACTILNNGNSAAEGAEICPFSVYLNDELISSYTGCVTGSISSPTQLTFKSTYSLRKGWNKFQVLVYVSQEPIGDGENVGILIEPNPFKLAVDNKSVRIQGDPGPMNRISEFRLRNISQPGDNTSWAWLEQLTGGEPYGIILNHNPFENVSSYDFDGSNTPQIPTVLLSYRNDSNNHAKGLVFKAELTKATDSPNVPKLHSYRLHIN